MGGDGDSDGDGRGHGVGMLRAMVMVEVIWKLRARKGHLEGALSAGLLLL